MAQPVKLNLKVYQGSTFKETLRWESATKIYKPITGVSKSAPVEITSVTHNIPSGWRVRITNVSGMKEINSATDVYYKADIVSADIISINSINSLGFSDYVSGGVIEYNEPIDLSGFTARMQVRTKLETPTTILELTTENGGIIIDNVLKTITLYISAVDSALLDFSDAVYSLELVSSTNEVTPFCNGKVSLVKEVTR